MKSDDLSIEETEILYRYSPSIPHPNWTVTDQETREIHITSAALQWDADGISCYRETILRQHQLDWSAVKREAKNGVFSLTVADDRLYMLGVAFDPHPPLDEPHPRDAAHSLIVDRDMTKKQRRDARDELCRKAKIIHHGDFLDISDEPHRSE